MTITTRTIEFTLLDVVTHAQDTIEEAESKIDEIRDEITDLKDDDKTPPDALVKSLKKQQSTVERQREVVNRTLTAIDTHYDDLDAASDATLVFEELNIGDGVDMTYSAGIGPDASQNEIKSAEREMMAMYLNRMVEETPPEIPDDMTELPMAIGEGIFNVLDARLEEGNTDLSVSQIREHTTTS